MLQLTNESQPVSVLHIQLEKWTHRAQQTLRTATDHVSIGALSSRITAMTAEVLRLAVRRHDVNAKNSFAMLPSTLLRRILDESPGIISDVLVVSQSCSRVRSVILESPEFWNRWICLTEGQLGLERLAIQRSNPTPLEMRVDVAGPSEPPGWTNGCCQIVAENLVRLSRLTLVTELDTSPPAVVDIWGRVTWSHSWGQSRLEASQWGTICHALQYAAPLLREFFLYRIAYNPPRPLVLPPKLFDDEAPLLRSCVLNSVILPERLYPAFTNLVTLHYHAWHGSPALQLEVTKRMLDDLTSLEMLCLSGHQLVSESGIEDTLSTRADTKRARITIRVLRVRPGSLNFGRLYNFFRACGAQKFECKHTGTADIFADADSIMQACTPVKSMRVLASHIELRDSMTTLHVQTLSWRGPLFLLNNPHVYAQLVHLTLDEWYWPEDGALPVAPCLSSLCIVLGSCADYRSHSGPSMPFGFGTCSIFNAEHPWVCPALRSVQLAYRPPEKGRRCHEYYDWIGPERTACCCTGILTVSYRDAYRFIATCLRFEGCRLTQFKMSGVEPVDPDARDLLYTVAEDVQISSTVDRTAVAEAQWHSCDDALFPI